MCPNFTTKDILTEEVCSFRMILEIQNINFGAKSEDSASTQMRLGRIQSYLHHLEASRILKPPCWSSLQSLAEFLQKPFAVLKDSERCLKDAVSISCFKVLDLAKAEVLHETQRGTRRVERDIHGSSPENCTAQSGHFLVDVPVLGQPRLWLGVKLVLVMMIPCQWGRVSESSIALRSTGFGSTPPVSDHQKSESLLPLRMAAQFGARQTAKAKHADAFSLLEQRTGSMSQ